MAARGDEPARVDKTRRKYLRAPGMLVVGSAAGDTPLRTIENRDAVAAGIQNVLLGATAAGLASFWSSCPKGAEEAGRRPVRLRARHRHRGLDLPRLADGNRRNAAASAAHRAPYRPRLSLATPSSRLDAITRRVVTTG